MEYKIIFTTGYSNDIDSLTKELKCDVLIFDGIGNYYNPQFITIERIKAEFDKNKNCYLEDNLVIMHEITKETILNAIPELHKWLFFKRWIPLTTYQIETYFYPKSNWVVFTVIVEGA